VSQQKKPLYNLCPRSTDKTINQVRNEFRDFKKLSDAEILGEFYRIFPEMINRLDTFILSEERFWETEGNNVIFPESADVLNNLYRAKYNIENLSGFQLPFKSFILAMPAGFKIDGFEIPSCLITWEKYRSSEHSILYPFLDWIKFPRPMEVIHQPSSEDEMELGIIFRDPDQSLAYHRTLCFGSALPEILKAKDTTEFQAILGNYSFSSMKGIIDSNDKDLNTQFRLFKLIAALGVYNMATERKHLVSGFPGTIEPKMIGRTSNQKMKVTTLENHHHSTGNEKEAPGMHYRTWFFRQLMDDRYYRGEYSDYPKGSRISFVPDTVVNRKVSAHTQK
jgi:hypothetical protein